MNRSTLRQRAWFRHSVILLCGVILAVGIYLYSSQTTYRLGFPLDDAWIYQTYARNLADTQQWAYVTGVPSGGSTSPLWVMMLAAGYLLRVDHLAWAYGLGAVLLLGLALAAESVYTRLFKPISQAIPWVGLFFAFEWHFTWAAVSGMETVLFSFGLLVFFRMALARDVKWFWAGALAGACTWARPEGFTLLPVLLILAGVNESNWRGRLRAGLVSLGGAAILIVPYYIFNYSLSGYLLPNTFFAKQAEYGSLQSAPIIVRFLNQLQQPVVGAGVMLAPGFLYYIYRCIRQRAAGSLILIAWFFGYLLMYAWRLPVVYQHGRYLIPCMTVYFLLGLGGTAEIFEHLTGTFWKRILRGAWAILIPAICAAFFFLGARAYGQDAGIIETEMVNPATWISRNIPTEEKIAAHDIGALGYFCKNDLVDMAGLISPEVIGIIQDQARLRAYLKERGVHYLMTFPGLYPELVRKATEIYSSGGAFSPLQGGENMRIYKLAQ